MGSLIVMENLSVAVFLNTNAYNETGLTGVADASVAFGNFCLTPIRCLLGGDELKVNPNNGGSLACNRSFLERSYLQVIASIVLLIPGLLLGCVFKGLGYLSGSIRERHALAIQHYTPKDDAIIGTKEDRIVNVEKLEEELEKINTNNHLQQHIDFVVIYTKEIAEEPFKLTYERVVNIAKRILPNSRFYFDHAYRTPSVNK